MLDDGIDEELEGVIVEVVPRPARIFGRRKLLAEQHHLRRGKGGAR